MNMKQKQFIGSYPTVKKCTKEFKMVLENILKKEYDN